MPRFNNSESEEDQAEVEQRRYQVEKAGATESRDVKCRGRNRAMFPNIMFNVEQKLAIVLMGTLHDKGDTFGAIPNKTPVPSVNHFALGTFN